MARERAGNGERAGPDQPPGLALLHDPQPPAGRARLSILSAHRRGRSAGARRERCSARPALGCVAPVVEGDHLAAPVCRAALPGVHHGYSGELLDRQAACLNVAQGLPHGPGIENRGRSGKPGARPRSRSRPARASRACGRVRARAGASGRAGRRGVDARWGTPAAAESLVDARVREADCVGVQRLQRRGAPPRGRRPAVAGRRL